MENNTPEFLTTDQLKQQIAELQNALQVTGSELEKSQKTCNEYAQLHTPLVNKTKELKADLNQVIQCFNTITYIQNKHNK